MSRALLAIDHQQVALAGGCVIRENRSFVPYVSRRTYPVRWPLSPPPSLTDSAPLPGARHEPRSAEQGPPPFPHYQFGAGRRRSPVVRPALRQRRQPFSRKQPRRFHDRRPDPAQRPFPHRGPRQPHRHRRGDQGRQVPCRRQRRRGDAPSRQRHPGDRPAEAHRDPRSQRLAPAPDPRWPQLQPGAALGRRALPGRRLAHAQEPGRTHAQPPVGAGGRRLERVPVRREAHADPGGIEQGRAGHPGVRPPPVRSRPAQPRRPARGRLHQGHAQPARRRDRPRQQRRTHRHADRPAQRDDSLRHPGQGTEAAAGIPGQLHPPVHARTQPPRPDQRDRRRRRLPELPGRLPGDSRTGRPGPAHRTHRLQPVHPETEGRTRRLQELDRQRQVRPGQRFLPP